MVENYKNLFSRLHQIILYLFVFSLLFLGQKILFGIFIDLHRYTIANVFYTYELVLTLSSIFIIMKFIRVYSK